MAEEELEIGRHGTGHFTGLIVKLNQFHFHN